MSIASCFAAQTVVVLGLGRTGIYAALALQSGGSKVLAWDDTQFARSKAIQKNIAVTELEGMDWSQVAAMVLSPGIPHKYPAPHPIVVKAIAAGVPILSDIDVLGRCYPEARYIGVTGTNGKTTTTSLIGHVLNCANVPTYVAGNIGTSVFSFEVTDPKSTFVLEMSSFQLELTSSIHFETAILLNLTPDHLIRHGGIEGYVAAKQSIFSGGNSAVIGVDSILSRNIYQKMQGPKNVIPISVHSVVPNGVYIDQGILVDDAFALQQPIVDLRDIPTLQGPHNGQNAAAAYIAAKQMGVSIPDIIEAFKSFTSLPHRQETVAMHNGVRYVNDSKATNVDAAMQALARFDNIHWILGGRFKEESLEVLYPYLNRVQHAYLIGEAADQFASWLEGRVVVTKSGTLEQAVASAANQARKGAVVLLAPACASFDQFKNFEARGEAFRQCVQDLSPLLRSGSNR
ncbi:MAG: UDP-N-acetylmuramoyl-L-alanine--D-glutamate ligase [Pseudomonadota bacterium]